MITLNTTVHRHDRNTLTAPADIRHLTALDRIELRIGLWLLLRGARRREAAAARRRRRTVLAACAEREWQAHRAHLTRFPRL
ncbi:hypothetical protein [Microbacterium xanthum]|uniref:hypothetical protein n=1 Tax=Microbacterium xanthum TaxID=3079794 RepID=UPI002AD50D5F|nr:MULTISPECIES: hypothetical protein [unclassified Microbacterium]MDZ8172316.1 hypothetical protein [Microbacterium sp. KSW-48]MDZ8201966.1 hypothetical protein [Microbacterium sp. SSW1-59]